jgi:DNA adenine methylase
MARRIARAKWSTSIIRWAGSKRSLLPILLSCVPPQFSRYVEPFAGSGTLFFALKPNRAVLGDLNGELIQTYAILRDHPRLLHRRTAALPNNDQCYYRVRRQSPTQLPRFEAAVRFLYLNRYCFNGVYRTNRNNEFNVPRGASTGSLPSEAAFYRAAIALRRAELRAGDFATTLADIQEGDFVYIDPPYDTASRPRYGEYGYGSFSSADLPRLVQALVNIDRAKAYFLLSYADTAPLRLLAQAWWQRRLIVRRHVAGFAEDRSRVRELLVSNYSERR